MLSATTDDELATAGAVLRVMTPGVCVVVVVERTDADVEATSTVVVANVVEVRVDK